MGDWIADGAILAVIAVSSRCLLVVLAVGECVHARLVETSRAPTSATRENPVMIIVPQAPPQPDTSAIDALRHIATALAARAATPDDVLGAFAARHVDRGLDFVQFAPAAGPFTYGSLRLRANATGGPTLASLTLLSQDAAIALPFATLERAFGPWTRDVPGVDGHDAYVVFFRDKVRVDTTDAPATAAVFVSASLSADPASGRARVARLLFRRDIMK